MAGRRARRVAAAAALSVIAAVVTGTAPLPSGGPRPAAAAPVERAPARLGYWLAAADGGVFAFGRAGFHGSMGGRPLAAPIVGMAATPSGAGYWLVAADGGVFAFGRAGFHGSMGGQPLAAPIVGMAATASGAGYWLVAADGGVFAFGDAAFRGSAGGRPLDAPVVDMAALPWGDGYWLVAADGGVFSFGAARFYGSTGGRRLNATTLALAPTPTGAGYRLVAADGGVFSFGAASFLGSTGGLTLAQPVVTMATAPDGDGYWLIARDGGVFAFGSAPFLGSAAAHAPAAPVIAAAVTGRRPAPTAVFHYPWWGTPAADGRWRHWEHTWRVPPDDIGSNFYPDGGPYSSTDAAVIERQLGQMAAAGIATMVTSWWGRGSFEDRVLPDLIAAGRRHGVDVAVHLEHYPDRTPETVDADLWHLSGLGVDEVWIYRSDGPPAEAWRPVTDRWRDRVTFWAHGHLAGNYRGPFLPYAQAAGFHGIYTYDALPHDPARFVAICAAARARGLACSPSVNPGYDGRRGVPDDQVRDREAGARYDRWWTLALAALPDVVSITSWNEWHEGTQIEPAMPFCAAGYCYSDYEGAYGHRGPPARRAYLSRTAAWASDARAG